MEKIRKNSKVSKTKGTPEEETSVKEENSGEETQSVNGTKVEDTKVEDTKVDDTKVEDVKVDDAKVEGEEEPTDKGEGKGEEPTDDQKDGLIQPEDEYAEAYEVIVKIIKGSKKPQDKIDEIISYLEDAGFAEFALSVKQLIEYSKTMQESHDLDSQPGIAAQSNLITVVRRGTGHPTLFKVTIELLMFFMRNYNGKNKDTSLPTGFKKEGMFRFIDELKLNENLSEEYNKFLYFISSMSVIAERKEFVSSINPGQLTKWTTLLKEENIEYLEELVENA